MKVTSLEIGPHKAILVGLTSEDAFNLQCGTALMTEPGPTGMCVVFIKDSQEELEAGFADIRRRCEERFGAALSPPAAPGPATGGTT